MKRMISVSTSVVVLLSLAVPAMAMVNTSAVAGRMSRRLVEEKARADQRVPFSEVETMLRLSERKQAVKDTTSGLSNLSRSRITTRIHTLRGARTPDARGERPSRRSLLEKAGAMLELPTSLVQTGGSETESVQRVSRRTLVNMTEVVNRLQVGQ